MTAPQLHPDKLKGCNMCGAVHRSACRIHSLREQTLSKSRLARPSQRSSLCLVKQTPTRTHTTITTTKLLAQSRMHQTVIAPIYFTSMCLGLFGQASFLLLERRSLCFQCRFRFGLKLLEFDRLFCQFTLPQARVVCKKLQRLHHTYCTCPALGLFSSKFVAPPRSAVFPSIV